jgi:hypothetical protein
MKRTASDRVGSQAQCIRGLLAATVGLVQGSVHSAAGSRTTQISQGVDRGRIRFRYHVVGTATYTIDVSAPLDVGARQLRPTELQWSCTCPSQADLSPGKACKHVVHVLLSLVDRVTEAEHKRRKQQDEEREAATRATIEARHPGERARIVQHMQRLGRDQLAHHLFRALDSVDGFGAMLQLFPVEQFPLPRLSKCRRCGESVDLNRPGSCQLKHDPEPELQWQGSKYADHVCSVCEHTWPAIRGGHDIFDGEEGFCFVGEHDFDLNEEEGQSGA